MSEVCEKCCLLVKGLSKRRKKLLQSFPTNPLYIAKKLICNCSESDCLLDKCSNCKSSVIFETFISNVDESESETSIATTDDSSDNSSEKCHVAYSQKKNH